MKKIMSVIALVIAMTMVMGVSAFAAAEFIVDEADITDGVTVTPAANSITVGVDEPTSSAQYSILLVEGDTLPTVDSAILYINQATGEEIANFNLLPIMPEAGTELTLYIGSNEENFELIAIPLVYDEERVESYMVGDVDGDTSITIGDVTTLIDKVLERIEYFTDSAKNVLPFYVGDVDNDESVTIGDVTTVIDRVLERITSFPRTTCELPAGTTAGSTYPAE